MGHRIRSLRVAIVAASFIALTALPGTWSAQVPGNAFSPTAAWAGGTPDETLVPPPTPPKKAPSPHGLSVVKPGTPAAERSVTGARLSSLQRWIIAWNVARAMALRH